MRVPFGPPPSSNGRIPLALYHASFFSHRFPENEKLWARYAEIRAESLREGHGIEEPCWRYSDPYRTKVRIHTKLVSEEQAS